MIVLSGSEARKIFFNEQGFDLLQGYGLMLGSMPDLDDVSIEADSGEKDGEFVRRNLAILGKGRIKDRTSQPQAERHSLKFWLLIMHMQSVPPILLEDMNVHMLKWGKKGTMDPFREIYRVRPKNGTTWNCSSN